MFKSITTCVAVMVLLMLGGCGDSGVSTIQSLPMLSNKTYKIGDVYNGRPVCADTSWKQGKGPHGRKVVEYRCVMKGVKAYFNRTPRGLNPEKAKPIPVTKVTQIIQYYYDDKNYGVMYLALKYDIQGHKPYYMEYIASDMSYNTTMGNLELVENSMLDEKIKTYRDSQVDASVGMDWRGLHDRLPYIDGATNHYNPIH